MAEAPVEENSNPKEPSGNKTQAEMIATTMTAITDDLGVQFVDLIRCDANAEMVVLSFLQGVPPGVGASKRLVARFAISWPHLMRARDLFDKMIARNKDRVLEAMKDFHDGSHDTEAE